MTWETCGFEPEAGGALALAVAPEARTLALATAAAYEWTTAERRHYDPYYARYVTLRIAQPVCDDANYAAELGWTLAGIIGNRDHWMKPDAGDHTSRSTHNGRRGSPKTGWVYADDIKAPDAKAAEVERAVLDLARAGKLPQLKYFNINNRHWTTWNNFSKSSWSGDKHLHTSYEPTYETATGRSVLRAAMEAEDMQLSDKVNLTPGQMKLFPDDPGIQDGSILVQTALGGSYTFSRHNMKQNAEILALVSALAADRAGLTVDELRELLRAEHERAAELERAERQAELEPLLALMEAHSSGTLDAEEVVRRIGALLSGVTPPQG